MASETGMITRLLYEKAFGFVKSASHGSVFFHRTDCVDWPYVFVGAGVTFDVVRDASARFRAINVQIVSEG